MSHLKNALVAPLAALLLMACASTIPAQIEKTEMPMIKPLTPEQLAVDTVRVAAVQITGNWFYGAPLPPTDTPTDKLIPYIERAAADGADLVVFPELYMGLFRVPHPETEKVSKAARENNINVIVGTFEIVDDAGEYVNSTLVFNREGEIIGRYWKMYQAVGDAPYGWPPKVDDPEWIAFAGEDTPVFDLDFGRIGILTCYDGYFPELFRQLSLKGAEVIIWPNARHGLVEDYIVKTNMQANYVHMICTNKAIGGGTMIAHWPTNIVSISNEAKEDYHVADLNMAQLRHARTHAREFHQRRGAMHAELAHDFPVWEYYGQTRESLGMVAPPRSASDEHRIDILKRSGVWEEPAELE